jgi:hypothetical protein
MPYTDAELADLTDEEREAIMEGEGDEDAEGTEDQGGAQEDGGEGAGDDADDAAAGGSDVESEAASDPAPAQAPILVADAPERADERLKEISAAKSDLRKKYDEGELTFDEYEGQVEALDEERLEIKLALKEAETAAKIEHQRQVNEREAQINGFLSEHNIRRDFSDLRFAALDTAVKVVANNPENAELSVTEILQKAMDLCVEQGVIAPRQQQAKPEKPARKSIQAPPTLAKVPAADMTGTDDGNRFAYIDRLDPVARENAVARLSPADLEAYLSA